MQDLVNYKSKANIIPITRVSQKDVSPVLQAVNKVIAHFSFKSVESKKKSLSQLIYRLELLDVNKGDVIFELGTGSGLQTAALAELGAQVITVGTDTTQVKEMIELLDAKCKNRIEVYAQNEISKAGSKAPFDRIIVAPEVSNIPVEFYGLLSVNGQMVITSDLSDNPGIVHVTRTSDDTFDVKKKSGLIDKSASYEIMDL